MMTMQVYYLSISSIILMRKLNKRLKLHASSNDMTKLNKSSKILTGAIQLLICVCVLVIGTTLCSFQAMALSLMHNSIEHTRTLVIILLRGRNGPRPPSFTNQLMIMMHLLMLTTRWKILLNLSKSLINCPSNLQSQKLQARSFNRWVQPKPP